MNTAFALRAIGRVRQQRLALGWTQADAAAHAGISGRSYERFERGSTVTLPRLERVLAAFGLSLGIVAADGAPAPTPDPRLARQRGLRHARPAAKPPAPPPAADAPPATVVPKPSPAPTPPATIGADRIAAVLMAQRNAVLLTVRTVVGNQLTNYTAWQTVQNAMHAARDLADGPAFVAAVESQLNALNAENIAGYGLGRAEYERWAAGWKPQLGIVDVAAAPR